MPNQQAKPSQQPSVSQAQTDKKEVIVKSPEKDDEILEEEEDEDEEVKHHEHKPNFVKHLNKTRTMSAKQKWEWAFDKILTEKGGGPPRPKAQVCKLFKEYLD